MRILISIVSVLTTIMLSGCSATSVGTTPAQLGTERSATELVASLGRPGIIVFEKHTAADWQISLAGLLNLNHPKAIAANITDKMEAIEIYTYSVKHPTAGTFIVDSGVSAAFADPDNNDTVSYIVKVAMGVDLLKVKLTTAELAKNLGGIDGVFLTHIHLDHIMGLTDLDSTVPVYIGPGDAAANDISHLATSGSTDSLLSQVGLLNEWAFEATGYIDVFGDGSFWAIHSPGHTPGATAYLANTTSGPHLMLGDVTHTKWGWENGVEPGSFSADQELSATSLQRLVKLVEQNQHIQVHPGHQAL